MSKTILQVIKYCNVYTAICNSIFRKMDKFTAELHPIPVTAEVWHTVGVDLIGPLTETARGNEHIIIYRYIRGATKFPSDRISCVHSACGCLRHVIVASRLVGIRSRGATEFPSDRISCDLHRKFCRNVPQNFLGNTVALIKSRDRIS